MLALTYVKFMHNGYMPLKFATVLPEKAALVSRRLFRL